ncbi:hypothetical protein ColKHC_11841 [Colletotrichum higginsianum]|nr:hypothetical protein ColKHC_11841 [Colletotrichum higginsianum]
MYLSSTGDVPVTTAGPIDAPSHHLRGRFCDKWGEETGHSGGEYRDTAMGRTNLGIAPFPICLQANSPAGPSRTG